MLLSRKYNKNLLTTKPNLQIHGIDIAPRMIALASINNPSARFKVVDTRKLDTFDVKFDAIVCGFYLPYLSDTDCSKRIIDAIKIVKENGVLYLSFVAGNYENSSFKNGSSSDRTNCYYLNLKSLETNLLNYHFEIIKTFGINYPTGDQFEVHNVVIARKK